MHIPCACYHLKECVSVTVGVVKGVTETYSKNGLFSHPQQAHYVVAYIFPPSSHSYSFSTIGHQLHDSQVDIMDAPVYEELVKSEFPPSISLIHASVTVCRYFCALASMIL